MAKGKRLPMFVLIKDLCSAWQVDQDVFTENVKGWSQPLEIKDINGYNAIPMKFAREFVTACKHTPPWSKLIWPILPTDAAKKVDDLPTYHLQDDGWIVKDLW